MSHKKPSRVWVVVYVQSGVPVLAEAYRDEEAAKTREQFLSESINWDYDATACFEVEIGAQSQDFT